MTEPEGSEKDSLVFEFNFDATIPFRWTWERADALEGLGDGDRRAMLALFERLDKGLRSGDSDSVVRLFGQWATVDRWRVGSRVHDAAQSQESTKQWIAALKGAPLYSASPEEIEIIAGSRVALMYVPGTREYLGGTRPKDLITTDRVATLATNQPEGTKTEIVRESVFETLHFVRLAGEWRILR